MPRIPIKPILPEFHERIPLPLRENRLRDLIRLVQACRACPAMEGRKRVLTSKNGKASSRVMFIAEAPGRNGADRTGVPLYGDPSGNLFERLLGSIGWKREEVFITNAVLCNPRDEDDKNRPPTLIELANCSFNLEAQIRLVDPFIIATLGNNALSALHLISPHAIILGQSVATPIKWLNTWVFPLYHPSPRVLVHRSFETQKTDFQKLKEVVDRHA